MPDYLSHVFEGMQAGAALGHMIRQTQQAQEDHQLRQLTADRQFQLQQQTMAENDIKNRMSLAQNALPVNNGVVSQMLGSINGQQGQATPASAMALGGGGPQPDQAAGAPPDPAELSASPLVQGMAPQLSQGTAAATGGVPAIGHAPVLTKADASRTVKDSTGQQWQLMTPEEQAQRHLGSLKSIKEMEAEVEANKKLEELRNTTANEPQVQAGDYVGGILGIDPTSKIPWSRFDGAAKAAASIENAKSLKNSREAKQEVDPVVGHTVQEGEDGGSVMILTHKSGATEVKALAGVKAPGTRSAQLSAAVTGRQQAHDQMESARDQAKTGAKAADEVLKTDQKVQLLEHAAAGMTAAANAKPGAQVSYMDEKGKWQSAVLTPDLQKQLAARATQVAADRDQLKGQRDIKAKAIGWGTTKPAAAAAAPQAQQAGATPKVGEVVEFNGKKGRWTGTKFEPVGK